MAHPSHCGLREFGARCLGEFIRYAIKATALPSSKGASDSPLAVRRLLSRLYGLAAHPSAIHRLGFAFALNAVEV